MFTTPEPTITGDVDGVELGEEDSDNEIMYSPLNEKAGLRGRNVEDLDDFQEKGMLRPSTGQDGVENGLLSPRRRAGKGKELDVEKIQDFSEVDEGEARGLGNPRDRQAFALLILLCERICGVHFSPRAHVILRPVSFHAPAKGRLDVLCI